jgi:hypothetical protein
MASKQREKELLLEYPLLGSFLCLQLGALRQLGRLGVGIRNKKTLLLISLLKMALLKVP